MKLAERSARSALWLVARFGGRQAANTGAFFVIAAIIGPEDLGAASIAVAMAVLLRGLVTRGLRDYVIQSKTLTTEITSTAFWTNALLGLVLAGGLLSLSSLAGALFGATSIISYLQVTAGVVLIGAISSIQEALIERDFRHRILTVAQLVASVLAATSAVLLAIAGAGGWAVVALSFIEALGMFFVVLVLGRWRPSMIFDMALAREQISFAMPIMLSATISSGYMRIAQLIVGALVGVNAAAQFRVGSQVNQFLTQAVVSPINQMLLPTFSRSKAGADQKFIKALSVYAAVVCPVFLGAAAIAPIAIYEVMGNEWRDAAVISSILCLGVFSSLIGPVLYPLLIVEGSAGLAARLSIKGALFSLVTTSIGALFGIYFAAVGFVARGAFSIPASAFLARRVIGVPLRGTVGAIAPFALPALLMSAVVWGGMVVLEAAPAWLRLCAGVPVGVLIYGLAVRFVVPVAAPAAYGALVEGTPPVLRRFLRARPKGAQA